MKFVEINSKMFLMWCTCFCVVLSETAQSKPNIVLFIADDLVSNVLKPFLGMLINYSWFCFVFLS